MLYPLSYEGGRWRIPGRKPATWTTGGSRWGASRPFSADASVDRALRRGFGRAEVGALCLSAGLEPRSGGELGAVSLVSVEREAVDHERVAEEVDSELGATTSPCGVGAGRLGDG